MDLSEFDFHLPDELIAQEAEPTRDAARLMSLDRVTGEIEHRCVVMLLTFFNQMISSS